MDGGIKYGSRRGRNHSTVPADGEWHNLFTGLNGHQMYEIIAQHRVGGAHSLGY